MNKSCLLCQDTIYFEVTARDLFSWRPLQAPLLCLRCQVAFQLKDLPGMMCQGCQRSLEGESCYPHQGNWLCDDCYLWLDRFPLDLIRNQSLYDYSFHFREWLYRYKILGDVRLAQVVARDLNTYYRKDISYQWLVLPSSPNNLVTRGFHPTAYLLDQAGIPYQVLMNYQGDGRKQAQKTRQERMNLQAPFKVSLEKLSQCPHQRFLIFDDLYTTGATMLQAKVALAAACQQEANKYDRYEITSLTLARTRARKGA